MTSERCMNMDKVVASIKKNKVGIVFIILSALLIASGQALWKLSSTEGVLYIVLGFIFYVLGAILMVVAFRYGRLSVLHPLLSTGYIFAIFIGAFVINEPLTISTITATIIILIGAIMVGGGED